MSGANIKLGPDFSVINPSPVQESGMEIEKEPQSVQQPSSINPNTTETRLVLATNENNQIQTLPEDDTIIKPEEFDDSEMENLVLKPYEIKFKTLAWNKMNKNWIEDQKIKQTRISENKVNFKKIRKTHREKQKELVRESENDIVNSIKNSKIGKKINTEVLEKLFEDAKKYPKNEH